MANRSDLGVFVETGGDLQSRRTLLKFGKRVQSVILTNATEMDRLFEIRAHPEKESFYFPDPAHQGRKTETVKPEYFYVGVKAGETYTSPPFFARRGLVVSAQPGSDGCFAQAIVFGVMEGETEDKGV